MKYFILLNFLLSLTVQAYEKQEEKQEKNYEEVIYEEVIIDVSSPNELEVKSPDSQKCLDGNSYACHGSQDYHKVTVDVFDYCPQELSCNENTTPETLAFYLKYCPDKIRQCGTSPHLLNFLMKQVPSPYPTIEELEDYKIEKEQFNYYFQPAPHNIPETYYFQKGNKRFFQHIE